MKYNLETDCFSIRFVRNIEFLDSHVKRQGQIKDHLYAQGLRLLLVIHSDSVVMTMKISFIHSASEVFTMLLLFAVWLLLSHLAFPCRLENQKSGL